MENKLPVIKNYKDLITFNDTIAQNRHIELNIESVSYASNIIKVNGKVINIDFFLYSYIVNHTGILTGKVQRLRQYDYSRLHYLLHPEETEALVKELMSYLSNLALMGYCECDFWDFTIALEANNIVLKRCNKIKAEEVFIPSFITKIGREAFKYEYIDGVRRFYNLKKVTIQDGSKLKMVDNSAFLNCPNLKEINLPEGLEIIGDNAFRFTDLNKITIPSSVISLGKKCFGSCYNLVNVILKEDSKLKSIGEGALSHCGNLQGFKLPQSLEKIGVSAFASCFSFESIIIPNTVKELGDATFNNCARLKSIIVGIGVSAIPYKFVNCCKRLDTVIILGNIATIDKDAFKNIGITHITLPKGSTFRPSENDFKSYGVDIVV